LTFPPIIDAELSYYEKTLRKKPLMKKQYEAEQIIGVLRQCDVMLAQGKSIREI